MSYVVTNIDQVTPDWLTNLLRKKGLVKLGKVTDIAQTKSRQTNVSTVYFLTISFDQQESFAPKKLFLKIPSPEFQWNGWGKKEIQFYTEIISEMRKVFNWNELPFIRPYDVAYSNDTDHSHFLFEDISDEFQTIDGPPPTIEHCQRAMEAFALVHAHWWEHPKLLHNYSEPYTLQMIDSYINSAQTKLQDFIEFRGAALSSKHAEFLETVASTWPAKRVERLVCGKGITMVHRDPHTLNVLYSYDKNNVRVKIIDWQSWRVDTGTDDIAYYMACHWPTELRRDRETGLVNLYHKKLIDYCVENYTWEECWYDYRASVIRCVFFLMAAWSPRQWERGWWWDKLSHGLQAFEDLNCKELLAI